MSKHRGKTVCTPALVAQPQDPNCSFVCFPKHYLKASSLRVGIESLFRQVEKMSSEREVECLSYDPESRQLSIIWADASEKGE